MNATEPGRLLSGRYRLTAVIGRGGMGVVWRGRDELLNRDVAVKEIIWPPHLTEQEQQTACRRATREAQMAGRLSHWNVVRIYDIVEEDGHPSIVMELLPYRSLRDLVAEEGPVPPAQAARIALGVLAALRAAHLEGILHRDVKPGNILVGPEGRVVLTDFGIARAADSPTLTATGALLGSPSYIAPECAKGGATSAAADLWGLGASLYAAVEGHPPFHRNGALATLTAVVADEPEPPVHAGPLGPVIDGLLCKDPDQRLTADETERMLLLAAAQAESPVTESAETASPETASPETASPETASPETASPETASPEAGVPTAASPEAGVPTAASPVTESTEGASVEAGSEEPVGQPPVTSVREPVSAPDSSGLAPASRVSRGPRRSRRFLVALAALIVIAAAATVLAVDLTGSPGRQTASSAGSTRPAISAGNPAKASPAVSASATAAAAATSPATSSQAQASPSGSAAASGTGVDAAYGSLPSGYYRFTNSTGFSIGVPDGWQISHVGHYVYIRDPSDSGIFLLIDQSDHPNADPLADWEQQQANRAGSYPDYHLIRLESVNYPQAEKAADWEFTYVRDGVPVQILSRNVLANSQHAYALYWSTPESDWNAFYHYFETFAATFTPAS